MKGSLLMGLAFFLLSFYVGWTLYNMAARSYERAYPNRTFSAGYSASGLAGYSLVA